MQSKTSYFNATLFRKNLTRFWPLWGLASFVGALFPLAVLLDMVHRGWNVLSAPDFTGMYYDAVSAVPVINLVYAALCAMAVWSYLYNARSVGLMHTLPIRREGLFLTNFLSGLSMTLIPYAVTGVLCVVVSLCGGAFDVKGLAVTVLAVLGESFFYFSSATFVAFITGNAFAMPPLYALLHFLAVLLDWLISSFAQGFIFGFSTYYTGVVEWLSPTVYLVNNVRCARQYVEVQQTFPDGTPYTSRLLTSADLESFWLIGVYALVGLALAALALILYRRRRSETAGDVVAVGWLRPVFRYGVAGLCALLGGQFLYSLFWYGFQQGEYYDTLPMVVCLLAAGAIGYYGASMLLAKAFKVFRGSWKGLGIVLAGCALVTAESVDMDKAWFGSRYDRGTADYVNCPMTEEEYDAFWKELTTAQEAPVHGFEDKMVFEGCMPVEVMARRGHDTLCYGPLKPRGLKDPRTGKEPYAVVQLRRDNADGTVYNLVGFQTHLKFPEQRRVFSMIPALHDAEFLRYGVMHRNTFLNSPRLLDRYYRLKAEPRLSFAGQMTGVEGYVESAASGFLVGVETARRLTGRPPVDFPRETAIGALGLYVSNPSVTMFQPMNINFGIMPPLDHRVKGKRNKNAELSARSLAIIDQIKQEVREA